MQIVLGSVIGFMAGVVLSAKYLRREFAAMIEPRLKHIEEQLHNLRAEINLDAATRLASLNNLLEDRSSERTPR